ncbi:hypothetical protein [Streptomyces erythrochromogenes]|uniref:hypothetical protein n=1 Tax=Streptomyces erythrochromogenes TaxID=285574 RepID=UPI0038680FFE|nr:hypothetical protein OG364_17505 [Streptomyces erythrochromogenes]
MLQHRLAVGNGRLLESPSRWFDVPTLGALVVRIAVPLGGLVFYGLVLGRAPQFIYAVPVAWLAAVWWLSDSSATPPPLPEAPSGDVYAGEVLRVDRVERSPEGVTCTVHVVREEVNGP